jgi:hypothetical protein
VESKKIGLALSVCVWNVSTMLLEFCTVLMQPRPQSTKDSTSIGGPQSTRFCFGFFFKVAANLCDKGIRIVETNSPEEIDALRTETVRLVVQEGSEFINVDKPLISAEIRAMVDNIICLSIVMGLCLRRYQ